MWIVVLGLAVAGMVAVISRGSASHATHTFSSSALSVPRGVPAPTLHQVATYDGKATLIGGAIVIETSRGAEGRDAVTGKQIWSYERTDLPVCARGYNESRVFLGYGAGDKCDEMIALEAGSGKRAWQRTIESEGANSIAFGSNSIVSVGAQKIISYDQLSGFERFTLQPDAGPTDVGSGTSPAPSSSAGECVFAAASAGPIVNVLQKCRVGKDNPWVYTVLAEDAQDGNARQVGRTVLGLTNPTLIASFINGAALIADGTTLYIVGGGRGDPAQVTGIAVTDPAAVSVLSNGGFDLISTGTTVYRVPPGTSTPTWQRPTSSYPSLRSSQLATMSGGLLRIYASQSGSLMSQSAYAETPDLGPGSTVTVVGDLVAIGNGTQTAIYL